MSFAPRDAVVGDLARCPYAAIRPQGAHTAPGTVDVRGNAGVPTAAAPEAAAVVLGYADARHGALYGTILGRLLWHRVVLAGDYH